MTSIKQKVADRLTQAWGSNMDQGEREVMYLIHDRTAGTGRKITQGEIAKECKIGCHKFEEDIVPNKRDSTLRQVRQIIRNLRVKYRVPILSDRAGYWIPSTYEEVQEYVNGMERTARAQAIAWHETYKSVSDILNTTSSFFEKYGVGE